MSTALPEDYGQVTFEQAQELIEENTPEGFPESEAMYDGDHWLDGEGWPQPIDQNADGAAFMKQLIESMFESKNVVKEVTNRYIDGLLENEPRTEVTVADGSGEDGDPSDEQEATATTLTTTVTNWATSKGLVDEVEKAVRYALFGGRGYLRPYIPPGRRGENNTLSMPWADVFDNFFVTAVRPTNALIYEHPDTHRDLSIFHYKPEDLNDTTDPGRTDDVERVELSWVDPDTGLTYLRVLQEGQSPEEMDEEQLSATQMTLDLGGNLMLQEVEVERLITEQVRSSQKSLNMTKTMMSHNEVSSGFSEQIFLNAQPPGEWKDREDGSREFVPNEMKRGPFRSHFIQGSITTDEMGQETLANPDVIIDEPDDPEVYIRGKRSKRMDILDEVSQSFVEMKEQESGRSRLIARHEFTKTLQKAVRPTAELMKRTIENVLALGETFGTEATVFGDDLRVTVEIYPDSGPLTPEEMAALSTMTETGLMSMRTALSRAGINDIDAEIQRIKEEGSDRVQRLKERAELIKELVDAGATLEGAARVAGFDEEEAAILATGFDGSIAEAVAQTAGDGAPR